MRIGEKEGNKRKEVGEKEMNVKKENKIEEKPILVLFLHPSRELM